MMHHRAMSVLINLWSRPKFCFHVSRWVAASSFSLIRYYLVGKWSEKAMQTFFMLFRKEQNGFTYWHVPETCILKRSFSCREAFFPAPSVDSGVAEFVLKSPPEPMHRLDEEEFLAFVAISFQSKRKTLTNNLKVAYRPDFVQSCLKSIGLPKAVRAESLDVKLFLELFHCISKRD